jgi:oxygen-independent coproporphyrinogen-3 oxidase
MHTDLSAKYNIPVPRYTSYPTVPSWKDIQEHETWKASFSRQMTEGQSEMGISLYIHLPFCESLCIYCGCTKRITTNHSVEDQYIQAVLAEWQLYLDLMPNPPVIRELHLGGGTPTFFTPANLTRLIEGILIKARLHPSYSFSIEGHPNNTTRDHLETLYSLGFRRISYGVQDLNPEVQQLIHRIQPFGNVQRATEEARAAGFTSVNFDLIYGLPAQYPDRLQFSVQQSLLLRPDRVAFYSYAHIPDVSPSQKLIDTSLLPQPAQKLELYRQGRKLFIEAGYTDIGMDHFALPGDELYQAWQDGSLHRNFMGYTVQKSGLLLGLGLSAISDTGIAFAQNTKSLSEYYRTIACRKPAIQKGYFLNQEDKTFRQHILDIACKGRTILDQAWTALYTEWSLPVLRNLEQDGLVTVKGNEVSMTQDGRPFLRHVCKAFDLHLLRSERARLASNAPGTRAAFAASL